MPAPSQVVMLLFLAALPWSSGCQPAESAAVAPTAAIELDASGVTRRGALTFVRGWELGRACAAERHLPCLAFFTAEWCTYCRRMEQTTFQDGAVAQLASQFVCVLVDADAEADVCRRLRISGYPTVEILSPSGASLGRLTGWQSAPQMIHSLRAALQRYALLVEGTFSR
ncbi:MAG: thioredoxin family protein [Pirellulales bacterium]|nr:thioredoxin family protein [Pirellulales bacterium]